MRRIIFILCLLCAHWAARGQAKYDYRYWFDGDETTQRTGTSASPSWRMDVPLEGLAYTFHTLHFQVKDTAWSTPVTRYFMKLPEKGPQTFTYWFDHEGGKAQPLTPADGTALIDVASLADGLHTLHVAYGEGAHTGLPRNAIFWKLPIEGQLQYRLWADNDRTLLQAGRYTGAPLMVDVSQMEDGFHTLHAQVEGQASASIPYTKMFIKVPQTEGVDYLTCLFTVDNKLYKQEKVPSAGGLVHWEFDASAIPQGLHKAQGLVVTPSGVATNVQESFFYRTMTTTEKASMQCYYSIDSDTHRTQAGRLDGDLFHFDLDVAGLSDGFHRLSYMLMGNDGTSSRVLTAFFFKTPLGGNGITQYNYWLNDNEDQMHVTELEQRTDPFKLVTLLPVETCPIRSSCFQFEVEDGQPMLYARNDFHMRFYDASGRITEATEQFVDYKVSQKVTDVEPLEGAEGQVRHKKPEKDGILWYSIEAAIGDSLAIRSNQACTVQIFAPDGEEVYTASGAESVGYGGCHAYKDGTYYVAMHDVTATQGGDIALDYQHIDKYAVLTHTPDEIGAASGYFHVQLLGNGFNKLKRATFVLDGESLTADTIVVDDISNATLECYIANPSMPRGDYNLVLEFEEDGKREELTVEKALRIAEPIYGDIEIEIKPLPRTAKPYPVTVSVKNTGNVSYQMVPLYIGFDHPELIDEVSALNFAICMEKPEEETGSGTFIQTDNLLGKGINGFVLPTLIPNLEANSTMELQVGFVAGPHTKFNMYAWNYQPWSLNTSPEMANMAVKAKARPNPMCEIDPCEIASQVLPNWAECICGIEWGNISLLAGAHLAQYNHWARRMNNIYGEDLDRFGISHYDIIQLCSPEDIMRMVMEHCIHMPNEALQQLNDAMNQAAEDGCPDPDPEPIDILMPGDPNDIRGYQAPSESKYIGKGVTDAYYTIEFENDPEIANASAHHIVVTDTLDGTYLDLSSFSPTGIKLGSKDVMLDGEPSFVKTIDMRPAINVLAQVSLDYDTKKGIARWDFISLDPMTMEPTDHVMMGILPVNYDGEGQGEVTFDIKLKADLPDGVEISNRAAIVFDNEAPIITPTWTNVVDTIAPTSTIAACEARNDSTMILHFEASDNRSGVWKYDLYAQEGTEAPWIKVAEDVESDQYEFKGFSGINYGFCVVATDSAGNVEPKVLEREISQPTFKNGDANGDGVVDVLDATLAIGKYLGKDVHLNFDATDANKDGIIDAMDVSLIRQTYLSTIVRTRTMIEPRTRIKNIK